jgi:hypothetical protein
MKDTNKLLRHFLAKICEKNYSHAESLLQQIVVEKMSKRVKEKYIKAKKDHKKDKPSTDDEE